MAYHCSDYHTGIIITYWSITIMVFCHSAILVYYWHTILTHYGHCVIITCWLLLLFWWVLFLCTIIKLVYNLTGILLFYHTGVLVMMAQWLRC